MAIEFSTTASRPLNNEDNFPIGQEIILVFSEAADKKKLKESVVLFGKDFDRTSGPDNALWLNTSSGENPFFLRSPGFEGFADYTVDIRFGTIGKDVVEFDEDQTQIDKQEDRICFAIITPKQVLKEESSYNLFVVGSNIDSLENLSDSYQTLSEDRALFPRSVFDAYQVINGTNTASEQVRTYGSYLPANNEASSTVNIKIITEGTGSNAKYKWWFSDESEPQPANPTYSSRVSRCTQRWRTLGRGVLVKFTESDYTLDSEYFIKCYDRSDDALETSYAISFQTSTDSVYTYPSNQSTSPIGIESLNIPSSIPSQSPTEPLRVISMTPGNGSVNNDLNLKTIVIEFNRNLNSETVTQESVKILSYPVSGTFDGDAGTRSNREYKIYKIISVEDNKITLEL